LKKKNNCYPLNTDTWTTFWWFQIVDSYSNRWVSIILNDSVMRGFPGQCKVFRDTGYLNNAVYGERIKISFNSQTSSWTVLVLWCIQMDRLSLFVTNEIKYTEQYCGNKERKTRSSMTSWQFYLITNWQQCFKRIQLHGKNTYIRIKQYFNQH